MAVATSLLAWRSIVDGDAYEEYRKTTWRLLPLVW
jgi:hypothetical protein